MIDSFIHRLKIRLQSPLPGEAAQVLMAPPGRLPLSQISSGNYNPKKSAVLILLFPLNDRIYTLLIQRPLYEGVHSGQVAFPGGKFEDTDIDLQHTALRETYEEIGVPSERIEIIGKLSDLYITPSNFLVTPFIGYSMKTPDFTPDSHEVEKIVPVDLFNLNNDFIKSNKTISAGNGFKIKAPYFEIEGLTVWGATAMMISELNVLVKEAKMISID